MLALESQNTCERILNLGLSRNLTKALEVPSLRRNATRIVRNLCIYSGEDSWQQLKSLTAAGPIVLEAIMKDEDKLQEVITGAAACIFNLMTSEDSKIMFKKAGLRDFDLARRLFLILNKHQDPSIKVPSIRRYAIELAVWMMRDNYMNTQSFMSLGMERELESVLETTSELESFNIFIGAIGLCHHRIPMNSLVKTAVKMLKEAQNKGT